MRNRLRRVILDSTATEEELTEIYAPHEGSFDAGPAKQKNLTNPNGF